MEDLNTEIGNDWTPIGVGSLVIPVEEYSPVLTYEGSLFDTGHLGVGIVEQVLGDDRVRVYWGTDRLHLTLTTGAVRSYDDFDPHFGL